MPPTMARGRKRESLRLERGAGGERVFWEIERSSSTITTRFGKHLSAGRRIEKELASEADAKRAYEKAIAEKRKEGYGEPAPKPSVGASSVKGRSATNPEIEAIIEEDPTSPEGYLVYADWLLEQGDPRGELIIVQHKRSLDPDDRDLVRAEKELFDKFGDTLLGPLAKYTHIRLTYRSFKALVWRYGFLRAARFRRVGTNHLGMMLELLLQHPSSRFLEHLALGSADTREASDRSLQRSYRVLAAHAPKTLRTIVLGDGHEPIGRLDGLWQALPWLRSLRLDSSLVTFGDVRAEALEELIVGFAQRELIEELATVSMPALKTLRLTLTMARWVALPALEPFLRTGRFNALEELGVNYWTTDEKGRFVAQDELALPLVDYGIARKLKRLDLEMWLTEDGIRALFSRPGIDAIGTITIPSRVISKAANRNALATEAPNLVWTAEVPEPVELGRIDHLDI